jgi:hypothetical protein
VRGHELRIGVLYWIAIEFKSLRSPRLCVSKKTLRTIKRRGAEERGGCAVGEGKKWMGREILAASLSLQPEIDVAGTFYLLSTGLVGQPLHARMAGRRSLQGSAFPGGSLGTIGFERQA